MPTRMSNQMTPGRNGILGIVTRILSWEVEKNVKNEGGDSYGKENANDGQIINISIGMYY